MSQSYALIARIIGFMIVVSLAVTFGYYYFHAKSPAISPDSCIGYEPTCVDKTTHLLPSIPSLAREGVPLSDRVIIPCRLVGTWTVSNKQSVYQVKLHDDGTYTTPRIGIATIGDWTSGLWGVQGNYLLSRAAGRPAATKTHFTQIIPLAETQFAIANRDNTYVSFDLVENFPSRSCAPDTAKKR